MEIAIGRPPAGVDEFELLLSLDGGRTWPVRVTRELEGAEQVVRWQVPNLPAQAARIRVRFERDEHEVEGPPSASFQIVADREAQDLHAFHEGNWWEGMEEREEQPGTSLRSDSVPELSARSPEPLFEASSSPAIPGRPAAIRTARVFEAGAGTPGASVSHPSPQRLEPLRN